MPFTPSEAVSVLKVAQPEIRLSDPHICSDARARLSLLHALYEPLIRRAANGHFEPALSTGWTLSDDARNWSFQLRKDVLFHDGQSLTAQDVVASLTRIRDEVLEGELGTTGVYQGYLEDSTITATGNHSFTITTPQAMADLLDILVELFILPASHLSDMSTLPPGTGPFVLQDQQLSQVTMHAFKRYWGGETAVKRIEWVEIPSAQEREKALLSNTVDIAGDVVVNGPGILHYTQPSSVATTFMFNLVSGSLQDKRVRQALNYAVDNHTIIQELFQGQAAVLASPCTPTQLGFDPDLQPYEYNPNLAKALLQEVQQPDLLITFDIPERLPDEAPALAEILKQQFSEVGITLSVISHDDRPAYANSVRDKQIHDAACFDSSPHSSFRLFNEKFRSDKPGIWWLGYRNDTFDTLLQSARATTTTPIRQRLYQQAAQILHEDPPWLYLYNTQLFWSTTQQASGWQPSPDGLITFIR